MSGLKCLLAANGCRLCDCPEQEFASWTRRLGAARHVGDVIRKTKEASETFLNPDGSIQDGCFGKAHDWEK